MTSTSPTPSPLAEEALGPVAALYEIEADIRATRAEHRQRERQQRSRPLVEATHTWLTQQLERICGRSTLAQAIRYALNHWKGLVLYLDDGHLELDTNTVERAMRAVALNDLHMAEVFLNIDEVAAALGFRLIPPTEDTGAPVMAPTDAPPHTIRQTFGLAKPTTDYLLLDRRSNVEACVCRGSRCVAEPMTQAI